MLLCCLYFITGVQEVYDSDQPVSSLLRVCYCKYMISPRLLQGFRDYLPADMRVRQRTLDVVRGVYELYGFEPLDTPALEYAELLMGKYGEDEKLIYHFTDAGDREVALRYDLTVPLARVVAMHQELPKPFKRYQIAPVWRADSPQRGRFREFLQFDADIVGSALPLADAEMILLIARTMETLGLKHYRIRVNHRGVLSAVLNTLEVSHTDRTLVMRQIDKLEKVGAKVVQAELKKVMAEKHIQQLFELFDIKKSADLLHRLATLLESNKEHLEELARFSEVVQLCQHEGLESHLELDLSIVRGLEYYTGIIYEVWLSDKPEYGSMAGGGRYDQLMKNLAGVDMPAVGISLGVDRLLSAVAEQSSNEHASMCVMSVFEGYEKPALDLSEKLRSHGVAISVALNHQKIGKQLQYADAIGASVVLLYGEQEISQNKVKLRNMKTGEQKEYSVEPIDDLVTALKEPGNK